MAVLESIFEPGEPHFYAERPGIETAVAGAEVAVACEASGPGRMADVQRFVEETLAHTIAVGDVNAPFGGPHFFAALAFHDEVEAGSLFRRPGCLCRVGKWRERVARRPPWRISLSRQRQSSGPSPAGVWRAHGKFHGFRYREISVAEGEQAERRVTYTTAEAGDYRATVGRALGLIADGAFKKIVLARAKDVVASEALTPLRVLNGLRQRFADCYSFSFANGRGQSFIGASPEWLVRVSKGVLETEALAGSIKRGAGASEDAALAAALLGSEGLREQREVLDDMVARLRPLRLELEFPTKPALRRLANVQHLHTPVRAALPETVRLLDVLAALHPTPAVGGSPRREAVAAIRGLEGFPRGLYAGALGG